MSAIVVVVDKWDMWGGGLMLMAKRGGTNLIISLILFLTGIPLVAHICASLKIELCDCLITSPIFVPSQCLIARNVHKLFNSNCGISHLHEACHIDELSRGSVLGLTFSQTTSARNVP